MCGIAGFYDPSRSRSAEALNRIAMAMSDRLAHRGPDDVGVFSDAKVGLALGFRRLAIQDLTPEGAQPMRSASGRYTVVFNGEVYNFRELREQLEAAGARAWRGYSDTEVMLAAIEAFGLRPALAMFDGMFSFALYDRRERILHLARDRLGEKPLYYGWCKGAFVFGSELKALAVSPDWPPPIDQSALAAYMRYGYVPAPHSIHEGIRKLMPGTTLRIDLESANPGVSPPPEAYWDAKAAAESAEAHGCSANDTEAEDRLADLLTASIRRRLIADVPLGVFLSGGIDSSAIAALAQSIAEKPVRTFTIGFDDPRLDEASRAAAVAAHLGTDHQALTARPEHLLDLVHRMPSIYDEPFADASQLPMLLLAQLTRQHVTVALSGDGGDELFAGYPRYQAAVEDFSRLSGPMTRIARAVAALARGLPAGRLNAVTIGPRPWRLGDKLSRSLANASVTSLEACYEHYNARWRVADPPSPLPRIGYFAEPERWPTLQDPFARLMHADAVGYLPDDLLVKADRATMAVGLEARAPLLDHAIVEFVWSLPMHMKLRHGRTKWLLRQVLHRHVPAALLEAPKQGFEPPLGNWLRGPLRDWAEALLAAAERDSGDSINMMPVRAAWREHLAAVRDWRFELWHVLMFQAWRTAWQT